MLQARAAQTSHRYERAGTGAALHQHEVEVWVAAVAAAVAAAEAAAEAAAVVAVAWTLALPQCGQHTCVRSRRTLQPPR